MSDTPPPSTTDPDFLPERTHCEHCLTGDGVHFERWDWTLMLGDDGAAIRLYRDGRAKLEVTLTPEQVEKLMDKPMSMHGMLEEGL